MIRNYFKNLGIPGPTPSFLVGNFKEVLKVGIAEYDLNVFKKYGKTVGYFEGSQPVILTKDVKFIKAVMIKDFSNFVNRRVSIFKAKALLKYIECSFLSFKVQTCFEHC